MAMELSNTKWKLGFSNGNKNRTVTIVAGDWINLSEQIRRAKEKLGLPEDCQVFSCYEAGRDGFWIHHMLTSCGITNFVFDSSSIEVNRRKRRVKTDKVDAVALVNLLRRYVNGEHKAVSVVRIPDMDAQDRMRFDRERKRLLKERGAHSARIKSLLVQHGVRVRKLDPTLIVLRPSKFEGHCPMIRHGCRMALMVALNWSVECVKEES
ncbi:MAG: transposase [Candidatus Kentron sp. G]|nr:MAG: transposase [Candidatus Kentron sp. G]